MPQTFGMVGPVGPVSDGTQVPFRQGRYGEAMFSEMQGRFYEMAYRGMLFSNGCTITALTANTISLTASTTPILGLYNPSTSSVNLVPLQAGLTVVPNNLTSGAGPGAFVWASSIGNTAVSTGTAGFNHKTLQSTGAQGKGMSFVALTGLTNNLVIFTGSDIPSPSGLTYTTLVSTQVMPEIQGVQNFDGSIIVPPGAVLALLNTTSSTTWSVYGRLLWAEVAL
jgi:hypothetical protein